MALSTRWAYHHGMLYTVYWSNPEGSGKHIKQTANDAVNMAIVLSRLGYLHIIQDENGRFVSTHELGLPYEEYL